MRHFVRTLRSLLLVPATTVLLSCAGSGGEETRYLDRSFASLCEAFETIAQFALHLHVERGTADFSSLRAATTQALAASWGVDPPSAPETACRDIEQIAEGRNLSEQELYRAALGTFVSLLDPHSFYLSPEAEKRFRQEQRNEGFGIGIAPRRKPIDRWEPIDALVVEQVFSGSPASGVLSPGDEIVSIDGVPLTGKLFRDAWPLLTGGDSTEVTLEIEGRDPAVTLKRGNYFASPVWARTVRAGSRLFGYVKVREFTDRTAEIFRGARTKLEKETRVAGFLLDLRGCPGGLSKEAAKLVGSFVDRGTVYSTVGKEIRDPSGLNPNGTSGEIEGSDASRLPLAVLIDPGTASAAEIVAGTLRESSRALLVGERTFGKGTGQIPVPLGEKNGLGGQILLTMFRYYLFDGFSPQARGVQPHVRIPDADLERIVAEGKNKAGPPLYEEDYGGKIIPPKGGGNPSAPRGPLSSLVDDIERRRANGDFDDLCTPSTDDCAKETALRLLSEMADEQPKWPETELRGVTAGIKIRALDREREATYPSRHDGE